MSPSSWEEKLARAYWDYRWQKILEPLCETFQRWKAGEIGNAEVDRAIDQAYQEKCAVNSLLTQREDRAAALIQCWDREWFKKWIEATSPPGHVELPPSPCEEQKGV